MVLKQCASVPSIYIKRARMTQRFGVLILWLLLPGFAYAQGADAPPSISEACTKPAFRAFDFWIGRWVVRDSSGAVVGTSHIARVANGCGLREAWRGRSGYRGTSLNYYDAEAGAWRQHWVGSDGLILHLSGGLVDGAMTLTGERTGDDGPVLDRIYWRELPDGRVRQTWTASTDGGTTWERVFLGVYETAPDSSDAP